MTTAPSSAGGPVGRERLLRRPLILPASASVSIRLLVLALMAGLLAFVVSRRRNAGRWVLGSLALALLAMLVEACGSSSSVAIHTPTGGTPSGTYTITVTATSTTASGQALNHSTTVQLIVH